MDSILKIKVPSSNAQSQKSKCQLSNLRQSSDAEIPTLQSPSDPAHGFKSKQWYIQILFPIWLQFIFHIDSNTQGNSSIQNLWNNRCISKHTTTW